MKIILGLGNPGPEYDSTRHNVGWWVVDRLACDWDCGPFKREGRAFVCKGTVEGGGVQLMKPTTYMNRSGQALMELYDLDDFDPGKDLLVVSDDAALDVGRLRLRPEGGAGGHNGLRSVSNALGSNEYARLRVGVGQKPTREDLAKWVLAEMPEPDEDIVVELLPEVTKAVEVWVAEGIEAAMNRFNC